MKRGITVSPGVETTIEVTEVRRVRLSEPWGTCTSEEYLVTPEQDDHVVRYTSESCSELCKQDQVNFLEFLCLWKAQDFSNKSKVCPITVVSHRTG